ncbi:unnamed protein product, partial [Rotaria sp. Silwood2]
MAYDNWKQYFDFSPIENNRTNGLCKLCHRNYKDKSGIYSNFLKHFKRVHRFEYDQLFNRDNAFLMEENGELNDTQTIFDLTNTKYKENRIVLSIAKNLIVRCNLPLNLVEKAAFRDFLKDCNFKFPCISSKKLKRTIIPSLVDIVRKRIQDVLSTTEYVTLTVDLWSDRRCRSFIGLTCHLIDERMIPQAYLIDFLRFKSPHNNEAIHQVTEEVLERFNIKRKVFRITTDNASSMIKAYKFGLSICDNEKSNDDCIHPMFDEAFTVDECDFDTLSNDIQRTDVQEGNFSESRNMGPIRISCFAHTIQLCVRDGLKNETQISRVLEKCRLVAKFSNQSSKIADILEELNKHIHKMNITRWNSEYLLIKSILALDKKDLALITKAMDYPVIFLCDDFKILEEMIEILEPFYEISIKCQSDTLVTASLVVPAIVHIIAHLRDTKETGSCVTKLVGQLQSSVEKRFSGILRRLNFEQVDNNEPFDDPLYFMAA